MILLIPVGINTEKDRKGTKKDRKALNRILFTEKEEKLAEGGKSTGQPVIQTENDWKILKDTLVVLKASNCTIIKYLPAQKLNTLPAGLRV